MIPCKKTFKFAVQDQQLFFMTKFCMFFLSWYLWVEITLNECIVEEDYVLIQNNIRDENIILFDDLNTEFSKLKLTRFYNTKSKTHFLNKSYTKTNISFVHSVLYQNQLLKK